MPSGWSDDAIDLTGDSDSDSDSYLVEVVDLTGSASSPNHENVGDASLNASNRSEPGTSPPPLLRASSSDSEGGETVALIDCQDCQENEDQQFELELDTEGTAPTGVIRNSESDVSVSSTITINSKPLSKPSLALAPSLELDKDGDSKAGTAHELSRKSQGHQSLESEKKRSTFDIEKAISACVNDIEDTQVGSRWAPSWSEAVESKCPKHGTKVIDVEYMYSPSPQRCEQGEKVARHPKNSRSGSKSKVESHSALSRYKGNPGTCPKQGSEVMDIGSYSFALGSTQKCKDILKAARLDTENKKLATLKDYSTNDLAPTPVRKYLTRSRTNVAQSTLPKHGTKGMEFESNPSPLGSPQCCDANATNLPTLCEQKSAPSPKWLPQLGRKRKRTGIYVEDLDWNTSSEIEALRANGPHSKPMTKHELKAMLNPNAPVRHVLLGNETESNADNHASSFEPFVPDFIDQLHQQFTQLELEYAWLLEESFYIFRCTEPSFLFQYASPQLKICFRTVGSPPEHAMEFQALRREIRRKLRRGQRRGPIMSRVLAHLRYERIVLQRDGNGSKPKKLSFDESTTPTLRVPALSPQKMHPTPRNRPRKMQRISKKPSTPVEKNSIALVATPRSTQLPKLRSNTRSTPINSTRQSASIVCKNMKNSSLKNMSSMYDDHLSQKPASKKRVRHLPCSHPTTFSETNHSVPISDLLTEVEKEVAWLLEESCLIDPIEGPLLSFVQSSASSSLQSALKALAGCRRWLPRLYRGHDPAINQEFHHFRARIRDVLMRGFRRRETAHLLPRDSPPPPVAIRVRHAYAQFLSA